MLRKITALALSFGLLFQQIGFAQVAVELNIANYLSRVGSSFSQERFRPPQLRYFSYDSLSDNFKVLLDKGDLKNLQTNEVESSTKTLLNYFLVGVSLPDSMFWVNLRPDSEDQIIDQYLEKTDLGKVMLEADLQLKKDTAAFTSPQTSEGKEYWDKLYKKAAELYGYDAVTIPTLTRPWIVPGEIIVRESSSNPPSAYVYKAGLKVMLEQDYLKNSATYNFKDSRSKELNDYSSQLIRELIIPKLTREVNSSKRYAALRQVYYSLILSRWFKLRFTGQTGTYASLINSRNLTNLTSNTSWSKTDYFNLYKKSFAEGEYNIKEPVYTPTGQVIRSYFSGGLALQSLPVDNGFNIANSPIRVSSSPSNVLLEIKADDQSRMSVVEKEGRGKSSGSPLNEEELENTFKTKGLTYNLIDSLMNQYFGKEKYGLRDLRLPLNLKIDGVKLELIVSGDPKQNTILGVPYYSLKLLKEEEGTSIVDVNVYYNNNRDEIIVNTHQELSLTAEGIAREVTSGLILEFTSMLKKYSELRLQLLNTAGILKDLAYESTNTDSSKILNSSVITWFINNELSLDIKAPLLNQLSAFRNVSSGFALLINKINTLYNFLQEKQDAFLEVKKVDEAVKIEEMTRALVETVKESMSDNKDIQDLVQDLGPENKLRIAVSAGSAITAIPPEIIISVAKAFDSFANIKTTRDFDRHRAVRTELVQLLTKYGYRDVDLGELFNEHALTIVKYDTEYPIKKIKELIKKERASTEGGSSEAQDIKAVLRELLNNPETKIVEVQSKLDTGEIVALQTVKNDNTIKPIPLEAKGSKSYNIYASNIYTTLKGFGKFETTLLTSAQSNFIIYTATRKSSSSAVEIEKIELKDAYLPTHFKDAKPSIEKAIEESIRHDIRTLTLRPGLATTIEGNVLGMIGYTYRADIKVEGSSVKIVKLEIYFGFGKEIPVYPYSTTSPETDAQVMNQLNEQKVIEALNSKGFAANERLIKLILLTRSLEQVRDKVKFIQFIGDTEWKNDAMISEKELGQQELRSEILNKLLRTRWPLSEMEGFLSSYRGHPGSFTMTDYFNMLVAWQGSPLEILKKIISDVEKKLSNDKYGFKEKEEFLQSFMRKIMLGSRRSEVLLDETVGGSYFGTGASSALTSDPKQEAGPSIWDENNSSQKREHPLRLRKGETLEDLIGRILKDQKTYQLQIIFGAEDKKKSSIWALKSSPDKDHKHLFSLIDLENFDPESVRVMLQKFAKDFKITTPETDEKTMLGLTLRATRKSSSSAITDEARIKTIISDLQKSGFKKSKVVNFDQWRHPDSGNKIRILSDGNVFSLEVNDGRGTRLFGFRESLSDNSSTIRKYTATPEIFREFNGLALEGLIYIPVNRRLFIIVNDEFFELLTQIRLRASGEFSDGRSYEFVKQSDAINRGLGNVKNTVNSQITAGSAINVNRVLIADRLQNFAAYHKNKEEKALLNFANLLGIKLTLESAPRLTPEEFLLAVKQVFSDNGYSEPIQKFISSKIPVVLKEIQVGDKWAEFANEVKILLEQGFITTGSQAAVETVGDLKEQLYQLSINAHRALVKLSTEKQEAIEGLEQTTSEIDVYSSRLSEINQDFNGKATKLIEELENNRQAIRNKIELLQAQTAGSAMEAGRDKSEALKQKRDLFGRIRDVVIVSDGIRLNLPSDKKEVVDSVTLDKWISELLDNVAALLEEFETPKSNPDFTLLVNLDFLLKRSELLIEALKKPGLENRFPLERLNQLRNSLGELKKRIETRLSADFPQDLRDAVAKGKLDSGKSSSAVGQQAEELQKEINQAAQIAYSDIIELAQHQIVTNIIDLNQLFLSINAYAPSFFSTNSFKNLKALLAELKLFFDFLRIAKIAHKLEKSKTEQDENKDALRLVSKFENSLAKLQEVVKRGLDNSFDPAIRQAVIDSGIIASSALDSTNSQPQTPNLKDASAEDGSAYGGSSAVSDKELMALQPGMVIKLSISRKTPQYGKGHISNYEDEGEVAMNDGREIGLKGKHGQPGDRYGYYEIKSLEIIKASSSLATEQLDTRSPVVNAPGGIDFRALPMTIQPMGSFKGLNFQLPQLSMAELSNIDIPLEVQKVKNMVQSGTTPSGEWIKKLVAACKQKKEGSYINELFICLLDGFKVEEENALESSPDSREALVIVESAV